MPRYQVTVLFDATRRVVVEADDERAAKLRALEIVSEPSLCVACSRDGLSIDSVLDAVNPERVSDDTPLTEED